VQCLILVALATVVESCAARWENIVNVTAQLPPTSQKELFVFHITAVLPNNLALVQCLLVVPVYFGEL
jgi:hypothetical protein